VTLLILSVKSGNVTGSNEEHLHLEDAEGNGYEISLAGWEIQANQLPTQATARRKLFDSENGSGAGGAAGASSSGGT
jgi:hypothetical protein